MTVVSYPRLLQLAIEHGATNPPGKSMLHGEDHWKAVAITGLHLARQTPGADLAFIYSFAVVHDTMRQNDGADLEHGWRAAVLFDGLVGKPGLADFPRDDYRALDMRYALEYHVGGEHAREYPNISVGLCWDADRLNLWRVGLEPDDRYLTTTAGRTSEAKDFGYEMCRRQCTNQTFPSWDEIKKEFDECRFP